MIFIYDFEIIRLFTESFIHSFKYKYQFCEQKQKHSAQHTFFCPTILISINLHLPFICTQIENLNHICFHHSHKIMQSKWLHITPKIDTNPIWNLNASAHTHTKKIFYTHSHTLNLFQHINTLTPKSLSMLDFFFIWFIFVVFGILYFSKEFDCVL